MSTPSDKLEEACARMREITEELKRLLDDPSVIEEWSDVEKAWMLEHLEHVREEAMKTLAAIENELERRAAS